MNTMQSLEAVLQALPSGGVVRYNTYRHSAVRAGWNGNRPYSRDEAFRPFLGLVVILEAPEIWDEEEGFCFDEKQEYVVGVLSLCDPTLSDVITNPPEGRQRIWRFLCEPA